MSTERYSYVQYAGDGETTDFAVPFEYISRDDVGVTVAGVDADFTWLDAYTVRLSPAPAGDVAVVVRRTTPIDDPVVDFEGGSTLTEEDLDNSTRQVLYAIQEALDVIEDWQAENFPEDLLDQAIADSLEAKETALAAETTANGLDSRVTAVEGEAEDLDDRVAVLEALPAGTPDIWIKESASGSLSFDSPTGLTVVRRLNTLVYNGVGAGVSVDAGDYSFTIPAGTYLIEWEAPAYYTEGLASSSLLYNKTTSSTAIAGSETTNGLTGLGPYTGLPVGSVVNTGRGLVTLAAPASFELRHTGSVGGSNGPAATSDHAWLKLRKVS